MNGLFVPLLIGGLVLGTLVVAVTVQHNPSYRQDPRTSAIAPTDMPSPIAIPSPVSFYAQNTIVVDEGNNDHAAKNTLYFTLIQIERPGFLVIRESQQDQPGQILGTSPLLMAGRYENMTMPLSRLSRDGEFLFASLHGDDGDKLFNPATDTPLLREDGRTAMISFSMEEDNE